MTRTTICLTLVGLLVASSFAGEEIETFSDGKFNNDFFIHDMEFKTCCFEIRQEAGEWVLHLEPNVDNLTFDLDQGEVIKEFRVTIQDWEGGFAGNRPTSFVRVQGENDWTGFNAQQIGVRETIIVTSESIGRSTNEPIGNILDVQFQTANEGNSIFPTKVGAEYDDLVAVVEGGGPTCGDVKKMRASCKGVASGTLKAKAVLKDKSFDGEEITFSIDGDLVISTIKGKKAKIKRKKQNGDHVIKLEEPAGCVDPIIANCPL